MSEGADLPRAIRAVEHSMRPASRNDIEQWIVELSVITKKRRESDDLETLALAAYTKRLMDYPASVAHEVLINRTYHFFPSWDELKTVCEELVQDSRTILFSLKQLEREL